jgi:hypothetical protein
LAYDEHLRFAQTQSRSNQGENGGSHLASASPTGNSSTQAKVRQAASLPAGDDELGDVELPPAAGVTSSFVPQARMNSLPAVQSSPATAPNSFQPADVPFASPRSQPARLRQRRRSQQGFFVLIGCIGVAIVIGLVVLSNMQTEPVVQEDRKSVAKNSAASNGQDKSAEASDQRPPAAPPIGESPPVRPVSIPPEQPAVVVPQPIEAGTVETPSPKVPPVRSEDWDVEFNRSLKQVREALAHRNVAQAKEHVATCEKLAKWDEQREPLRLHQQLVRHTGDFWQAVSDGAAKLNGGEELEQNGKLFANVVESSATRLVVKVDGRNHRYMIPGDVDAAVAVAIARRAVSDRAEQAKLLGAFYAIDGAGDFSKAEQLWESAGDEMKPLLTLLKEERNNGKKK